MKKALSFILAILIISVSAGTIATAATIDGKRITSAAAIVIDYETGEMLYGYNPDTQLPPASTTKVMTVYLVYEAIAKGKISKDTIVPISARAYSISHNAGLTNVPLSRNEKYTVDELIDVVMVHSACGASFALAELVGGSDVAFIESMNAKAKELGMDALFNSTYGGSFQSGVSPRAMAILAREIISKYPDILAKTSKKSARFHGAEFPSTNLLLGVYEGLDGLKTGTSSSAGDCFIGTAVRGGRRIISVTLRSQSGKRFNDTTILLDYGFEELDRRIEARKVAPADMPVYVNGTLLDTNVYMIEGSYFIKARSLAYSLIGKQAQFEVGYDNATKSVLLLSGTPYTAVGGETGGRSAEKKLPALSESGLLIDGEKSSYPMYVIDGANYLRISDMSVVFSFAVNWGYSDKIVISSPLIEPEVPEESAESGDGAAESEEPAPTELELPPNLEQMMTNAYYGSFDYIVFALTFTTFLLCKFLLKSFSKPS
ncbi:MAG: D-alanyl-D-alanine carboxypeptidase [Oscillospiraceae bacterium]|nr:D-alanyl-D-alanine carboxypeptidase [Oscillospiraceae bacterium]